MQHNTFNEKICKHTFIQKMIVAIKVREKDENPEGS